LRIVADLARRFELLQRRRERQQEIIEGRMPDSLPETEEIREKSWTVAPIPADFPVEITGPVDRKMIINARNSGANVSRPISRIRTRPPGATTSRANSIYRMRSAARSSLRVMRVSSTA
jgi:hypothetical protein